MRRARRPPAVITGTREARSIAANLGRDARTTRRRRRLTQAELGALIDLGQSEISYLERGHGARTSIETWVAIGIALDRPVAIGFGREVVEPLNDGGPSRGAGDPDQTRERGRLDGVVRGAERLP